MSNFENGNLQGQYQNTFGIDQGGKVIAEYVWLDGSGITLRAKCRTLNQKVNSLADIPMWNFDGSSCYMATTENSEIHLKPVAYYRDPFRQGDNIMVLCETMMWEDTTYKKLIPANTNFRHFANQIWDSDLESQPWYGIEQEYTLIATSTKFTCHPLGWPNNGYPGAQGPYYCSVGANVTFGRCIADVHYKACLYAGITISGTNAEVMPGQWEYQVGPCTGVAIGDELLMSRYLLSRVAEDYGVSVSYAPKLFPDWNGSGCHTNYSTETMRNGSGGMDYVLDMMKRLAKNHKLHCELYGDDNQKRLTGHHETSSVETFSFGVGNRAASFRIPTQVAADNGKGYIEDRRPASNIDPYVVSSLIFDTTTIDSEKTLAGPLIKHFKDWQDWRATADIQLV